MIRPSILATDPLSSPATLSAANTDLLPPVLPSDSIYTQFWCEENIWLLVQTLQNHKDVASTWDLFAVFVSNTTKSVALWHQRLAKSEGRPVVWDYHCILLLKRKHIAPEGTKSWFYDFDTTLPNPCAHDDYLTETFGGEEAQELIPPNFQSSFRVVPGDMYLAHFASDRSHMLKKTTGEGGSEIGQQSYLALLPSYPPIRGSIASEQGCINNLMDAFVDMRESSAEFGTVIRGLAEFRSWIKFL